MTDETRPTGTVTFLFTDIEGSTQLWEQHRVEMEAALERHDEIMRSVIQRHGGYVFSTAGDAFSVAFTRVLDALSSASEAQETLRGEKWPEPVSLKVRMGLHTGEAHERDGDYFGPAVNRAARIMSAGYGGQVLLSAATAALVGSRDLVDLGEHRLRDLSAGVRLYQLGDDSFPAVRGLDVARHNLPVERTPLVGREAEVEEVETLVADHRLTTLLGMGGTGKTRLATAAAASLVDEFDDGVWFVDLVPAASLDQVVEAIATAASVSVSGADPIMALAGSMARREMLLVLDNCEHITDDVADVVDVLLERTESPRFLATSREPLQLNDERHVHVKPLAVADDEVGSPALELFTISAERVGVSIQPDQIHHVSQICARLDGLPLSIELAAAQLRQFTVLELADRLHRRFEILGRGRRGRGRRQASLQAVLEDTWSMLDPQEGELLLQLAAFPAGFTADDVDEVTTSHPGITPGTLAGLVDRSLVARDGEGRHRLLETVKLFAHQQWAATDNPERYIEAHHDWVTHRLSEQPIADRYTSIRSASWAHQHYDDHRAVEDRLAKTGATDALIEQLHAQIWAYQLEAGSRASALLGRIDTYCAVFDLTAHQHGRLRLVQAAATLPARRPDLMVPASNEAADLLQSTGTEHELAWALIHASWMKVFSQPDEAIADLDQAVDLASSPALEPLADVARAYRANHLLLAGRVAEAETELHTLEQRLGNRELDYSRLMLLALGAVHELVTDPARSWERRQELRERCQILLGRPRITWSDFILDAVVAGAIADAGRVHDLVRKAADYVQRVDNDSGLPDLLLPAATLAFALEDTSRARQYLTAIRHAPRPTGWFPITIAYRELRDRIGTLESDPLSDSAIEEIYQDSSDWIAGQI